MLVVPALIVVLCAPQGLWFAGGSVQHSRAAFAREVTKLAESHSTRDQVRDVLGYPDQTVDEGQRTKWFYGTAGKDTMATLGTLNFFGDKLEDASGQLYGDDEIVLATGEARLRSGMQGLYYLERTVGEWPREQSPLFLIRATNYLWSLGETTALDVLQEYCRVTENPERWGYDLPTILFVGKSFYEPFKNYYSSLSDSFEQLSWPTYPIVLVHDIPFYGDYSIGTSGQGPYPYSYIKENRKYWQLCHSPLRPGSDPFKACEDAYALVVKIGSPDYSRDTLDKLGPLLFRPQLRRSIIDLVSPLIQPGQPPMSELSDNARWSIAHRAFLSRNPRWSATTQRYVATAN